MTRPNDPGIVRWKAGRPAMPKLCSAFLFDPKVDLELLGISLREMLRRSLTRQGLTVERARSHLRWLERTSLLGCGRKRSSHNMRIHSELVREQGTQARIWRGIAGAAPEPLRWFDVFAWVELEADAASRHLSEGKYMEAGLCVQRSEFMRPALWTDAIALWSTERREPIVAISRLGMASEFRLAAMAQRELAIRKRNPGFTSELVLPRDHSLSASGLFTRWLMEAGGFGSSATRWARHPKMDASGISVRTLHRWISGTSAVSRRSLPVVLGTMPTGPTRALGFELFDSVQQFVFLEKVCDFVRELADAVGRQYGVHVPIPFAATPTRDWIADRFSYWLAHPLEEQRRAIARRQE